MLATYRISLALRLVSAIFIGELYYWKTDIHSVETLLFILANYFWDKSYLSLMRSDATYGKKWINNKNIEYISRLQQSTVNRREIINIIERKKCKLVDRLSEKNVVEKVYKMIDRYLCYSAILKSYQNNFMQEINGDRCSNKWMQGSISV